MAKDLNKIVDQLSELSVMEMAKLVKMVEESWGVSAAPTAVAAPAAAAVEAAEEKTEFNVILESAGDNKLNTIKVIREITGLGLAEAKAASEKAGHVVKEGVSKAEAEEIKKKLEAAGAKVKIS